jgi:predicted transcriptional regulator
MSISRKDWEEETFKMYRGASTKVLDFMKINKDTAYTSKEITEALQISQTSVILALRNLVKIGIVEAKKPYYILKAASSKKKVIKETTEEIQEEE